MFSVLRAVARPLIAAIFVSGGLDAARRPGGRIQAAASIGVPRPELAVRANGLAMAIAGLAFGLGVFPDWAAGILAALLIPTTVAGHPFWREDDPQKRSGQRTHFLKNVAMIGGLLLAAAEERNARVAESAREALRQAA